MKRSIFLPKIHVDITSSYWLDGHSSPEIYSLYVNDELYHVYTDREDMYNAINMLIKDEIGVY